MNGNVHKSLALRKKDNSLVYMEVVPPRSTVQKVSGAGMARVIVFTEGTGIALLCSPPLCLDLLWRGLDMGR